MSELPPPPPLVPTDCDLRDFPFMPIDITRLFGSDFHAQSTDAEWRAGVTLWLRSYHQVPASSLPDDEVALARLAELGRDIKSWRKIAAGALRGWTKCSDGRLYHKTVSEKALEGWIEKLLQRKASEAGNAKRYGHPFDATAFEAAVETSLRLLAALNPQSRVLKKRYGKAAIGTANGPPTGTAGEPPDGAPGGSPTRPPNDLPHHSQETETGKGKDISVSLRSTDARASDPPSVPAEPTTKRTRQPRSFPAAEFQAWYDGYPHKVGRGAAEKAFAQVMASGEVTLETLIAARDRYIRTKNPEHAWCNPATWLNQRRWLDMPATSLSAPKVGSVEDHPCIEFGGGVRWPEPTVLAAVSRWRTDPTTWPADRIGPPPGAPGCRVPERLLEAA